jgi:hypothetical protein
MVASLMLIALRLVDRSVLASRISMSSSLNNIPNNFDPSKVQRTFSNSSVSAPSATHLERMPCPKATCGKTITDTMTTGRINGSFNVSQSGSTLVVPPGPLAAAGIESAMSAVEELRLLNAQVQYIARVCNAAPHGDLSQKITVPLQGVIMVQLKDIINTMVFPECMTRCLICAIRWTNWVGSPRKSLVSVRKSVQKGKF